VREFKPRRYQEGIRDYILDNPRCAIWASMGLGKSVSTLTALADLDLVDGPALVCAPLRVAQSTWPPAATTSCRTPISPSVELNDSAASGSSKQ